MSIHLTEPGGFLLTGLASPSPSNGSPTSTKGLPHPRSKPLRPGSVKEETARRYVENKLLHVSRRYTKKFQPVEDSEGNNAVKGYQSMREVCADLTEVVDVLWLTATRE